MALDGTTRNETMVEVKYLQENHHSTVRMWCRIASTHNLVDPA